MSEEGVGEVRVPEGCTAVIGRPHPDQDYAIVASRYNAEVVEKLLEGAVEGLAGHGVSRDRITIVLVPGRLGAAAGVPPAGGGGWPPRGGRAGLRDPRRDAALRVRLRRGRAGHHRCQQGHRRAGRVRPADDQQPAGGARPGWRQGTATRVPRRPKPRSRWRASCARCRASGAEIERFRLEAACEA